MSKSVVIIGGGLGGLFTGAILAKEGLRVTVLEKNELIGGGLQSFRRFGETFDAGMHIVGGLYEGGNARRICQYLGILDRMDFAPVDDDCIDELFFAQENETYRFAKGRVGFAKSLASYFPHQEENIKAYVDAMYALADEVDLFNLRPAREDLFSHSDDFLLPIGEFINKYITDDKLRKVVAYMNPLYAGNYHKTPAYMHATINVLYINGASRFVGGCQKFAHLLQECITTHGGKVIAANPVVKIKSQDKLITEVVTASGDSFSADYFISAIHPCALFALLEDEKVLPKAYRTRLNELPNSYSAFSLYVKLKSDSVRYFNHTRYCLATSSGTMWDYLDDDSLWPRGIMFTTPPDENQGEFANKLIVTTPMLWCQVKQWEDSRHGHRPAEYERWKELCAERMLALLEQAIPNVRDCVEAINTASPLTVRDYYNVKEGSMYGFTRECDNIAKSQVPVVTKVRNLLLTGQNVSLHGFCGVSLTVISTSEAILGPNYIINKLNQ